MTLNLIVSQLFTIMNFVSSILQQLDLYFDKWQYKNNSVLSVAKLLLSYTIIYKQSSKESINITLKENLSSLIIE